VIGTDPSAPSSFLFRLQNRHIGQNGSGFWSGGVMTEVPFGESPEDATVSGLSTRF
jgi:hypothetical protein